MQLGKVKPTATIVAQFAAGVEVEAIQHEGKIYLPAIHIGEFSAADVPARKGEPAPEAPAKPSKSAPAKEAAPAAPAVSAKRYTKDEMMEMESKDLEKILRKEFGIDPNDYDGKNTNKKLRDLILDAQSKSVGKTSAAPSEESEGEDSVADDATVKKVTEILSGFDSGKVSRKKAVSALLEACDTDDTDAVNDLLDKFEDDGDATPEDFAQTIVDSLCGGGDGAGEPEGETVEISDLEKGDRVSVWWDDENKAWFDGEVSSVKRGKVHVKYDDGTEDDLDPEIHTEIRRIA